MNGESTGFSSGFRHSASLSAVKLGIIPENLSNASSWAHLALVGCSSRCVFPWALVNFES